MSAHRFASALSLLLQSHQYTVSLACRSWDFAVELDCLHKTGLTNSDLRWLLAKGYVAQAVEIFPPAGNERRAFAPTPTLMLDARSCFILTPEGLAFASLVVAETGPSADLGVPDPAALAPVAPSALVPVAPGAVPSWDKDRRILRLDDQIVKHFKVPAPNQELILTVFQEEDWPPRIDDPLPSTPLIDPKRRLHDTINSLNRNQRSAVLRFLGDGNGQGICWESLARSDADPLNLLPNGESKSAYTATNHRL